MGLSVLSKLLLKFVQVLSSRFTSTRFSVFIRIKMDSAYSAFKIELYVGGWY